jgi:thioredoxin-like negative regulator of GroEL
MQPRDFSLHGAVDLGARQAAAQRRQQAADSAGSAAPSDGSTIEVTDQTFNTDVLERSQITPVILDLCADRYEPCKQFSLVLEKLANEAEGTWILAKVDIDANPQISAALQVQSIPMVVAILGGQPLDGFVGAVSETQVRQWIGEVLATAEKIGLLAADETDGEATKADGYGDAGNLPPAYAEARAAMERGDLDAAARAFEGELAASPSDPLAKAGLAQVNLIRRVSSYDEAHSRRDAAERPGDVQAQIAVADIDLASGRIEEAFDRLLGVVRRTSGEDRDRARAHLVSLFDILPPRDPRVTKARSTLSAMLF